MTSYVIGVLGQPWPSGADDSTVVVVEPGDVVDEQVCAELLAVVSSDVVAVAVRPVTDTLKVVTGEDVVVGTADREHHRFVGAPFAIRLGLLRSIPVTTSAVEVLTALAERAVLVPV